MRTILAVNNYYYARGGAEAVFLGQNSLLEERGWQVVPFSMKHPRNFPTLWDQAFVSEIEFGANYSLLQKLRRVPKVLYSFEARRKLGWILDRASIDICHLHNIYHHISPSILGLLKQRGIPTVLTLHDLKLACPAYKMLTHDGICERCHDGRLAHVIRHRCIKESRALSALAYIEARLHRFLDTYWANVDRFIMPSRFYLDKFIEWGLPRDKLIHVPNFVDVSAYEPRRKVGRTFLYFGRLGREKGVATLVRAAALAKVPLRIAGTGPEEGALRVLAQQVGAEVAFLGHLQDRALKNVVAGARATILPSEWYENASMSILESYASAVPVVGAAIGGIGELIREGETGATFTSGSVEALVDKLREFADLPDARIVEMGLCGRAWVEAEFSGERYLERLLALYTDLGALRLNCAEAF